MMQDTLLMRTTVSLDPDVVAAIERLRAEKGLGLSEAVNALARRGLTVKEPRKPFVQRTVPGRLLVDISNNGELYDLLDQFEAEDARSDRMDS
ncbi:ribbon-helix-helix protein, CopG family [Methylocystis sp.]|uniref:ribbon-helix-helix protein, CopG family n=1 Tax=Methylocystis sp. TaxID=1911079 RepID=UPI003DA4512B